jgi:hypothetical protein
LWYIEGMAEYMSVGRIDPNTAMWLRDAAEQNKLPRIDQLGNPKWFPYRYGQALWVYLAGRFGEDVVAKSLKSTGSGATGRLVSATGIDALTRRTGGTNPFGTSSRRRTPSRRNLAGHRHRRERRTPEHQSSRARTATRWCFSPSAILLDRRLSRRRAHRRHPAQDRQTAGDPHFEPAVHRIGRRMGSSGRWFALAARSGGEAVLSIVDTRTGSIAREVRSARSIGLRTDVVADGKRLAFSGLKGGLSDLYG